MDGYFYYIFQERWGRGYDSETHPKEELIKLYEPHQILHPRQIFL